MRLFQYKSSYLDKSLWWTWSSWANLPNWVPHALKPRDVERRFCMSEMLLKRHKNKLFWLWIVTSDEKWIHYDNSKRKRSYVKPGQPAKSMAKPNIHGTKVMLCIWWNQKGVLYYQLLKPGEAINGESYRTQLIRLKRAIVEKRPEFATRHEAIIFHYDNVRPHVAIPVKNYLENSGWEVLPHHYLIWKKRGILRMNSRLIIFFWRIIRVAGRGYDSPNFWGPPVNKEENRGQGFS